METAAKQLLSDLDKLVVRNFSWRQTTNPYEILVSEVMLQQTQVSRVEPKYTNWLSLFPSIKTLAKASNKAVLLAWQGLGYNRRGLNLKKIAENVQNNYGGLIPQQRDLLEGLPGIGPYTAGAIRVFAWNKPELLLETNIRTVLLYYFYDYKNQTSQITDNELRDKLAIVVNQNPYTNRELYYRLMDLGVKIKKDVGNLNRLSKTHTTQSTFKGSWREKRAKLLKQLLQQPLTFSEIKKLHRLDDTKTNKLINELITEGFITKELTATKDTKHYTIKS